MDPLLLQNLSEIKEDIRDLKQEIKELGQWKAKIIGGSLALSFILSLGFHLAEVIFNK